MERPRPSIEEEDAMRMNLQSLLWFSWPGRIDTGKRDKFRTLTKCGIGQFEFYQALGQESSLWCLVSGPVVFWIGEVFSVCMAVKGGY